MPVTINGAGLYSTVRVDTVVFDYTKINDMHISLNLDRNNPMSYTSAQVSSVDNSILVNITENNTNDYTFTRA